MLIAKNNIELAFYQLGYTKVDRPNSPYLFKPIGFKAFWYDHISQTLFCEAVNTPTKRIRIVDTGNILPQIMLFEHTSFSAALETYKYTEIIPVMLELPDLSR